MALNLNYHVRCKYLDQGRKPSYPQKTASASNEGLDCKAHLHGIYVLKANRRLGLSTLGLYYLPGLTDIAKV
jgi:hypothetical protein